MKRLHKPIALFALLCLLLSLAPLAAAEDGGTEPDARFEGKTWDEVTEAFMEEHHTKPNRLTIGYYNTVTGEENYFRGDEYMISASMYKVPLNMVYTDRITSGEMEWDSTVRGYVYEKALTNSIVHSDNKTSQDLAYALGNNSWRAFRETLVPYMCEDQENVDEMFFKNNFSTARQMIFCLKLLYENPDRFPRIIDLMKEAEPKNYFNYHPQPVEVAHKYGYLTDDTWGLIMNDCGVIYTEDPFCLVVFTAGIDQPYDFLADYCTLMIDYTNYHTQLRHEEEWKKSREEAILALTVTPEPADQPQEVVASVSVTAAGTPASVQPLPGDAGEQAAGPKSVLTVLVLALTLAALLSLIRPARRKQLKYGWAAAGVLCAAAALLLCVYAPGIKPTIKVADPEGDPRAEVSAFFDALAEGDYTAAYACLYDYASLGVENEPEGEGARLMAQALRSSYGYELYGDCAVDGKSAKQQVLLDVLDLTALQADLKAATEAEVARMNEEMSERELLDEEGHFRKEITDAAYLKALQEVLAYPDRYKTSVGVELELIYTQDGWKIQTNRQLLYALSGKTAYAK